jgi:oleate hydratase
VFNSTYDVRKLLVAAAKLRDGKPLPIPGVVAKFLGEKIDRTVVGDLLKGLGLF